MKKISKYQRTLWLVWGVFLTYFGLQIGCTPENPNDRNVRVNLQIPLPNPNGLKMASSIAGIKSVMITVTTGNEILISKELTISGNTASGTFSIQAGKNRKFTAEARDEKNIIQWQGSTTVDIVDDFTVDIELTSIPPSATNLQALQKLKSINLFWTQNSDPDFASYELSRSPSKDVFILLYSATDATSMDYTDSEVSEGNTYYYTLFTRDTEGFTAKSNVVQIDLLPPTASKLQRDSLKCNSKYCEARLFWTQNPDADFARYELYRSNSENSVGTPIYSTTGVTNREYVDTNLIYLETYYYTLIVFDTFGSETKSDVLRVRPYLGVE